jgi:hypothetical protein
VGSRGRRGGAGAEARQRGRGGTNRFGGGDARRCRGRRRCGGEATAAGGDAGGAAVNFGSLSASQRAPRARMPKSRSVEPTREEDGAFIPYAL